VINRISHIKVYYRILRADLYITLVCKNTTFFWLMNYDLV